MSDDVLITPASRKIEFFDSGGNIDGKIELDASGNLNITSAGSIGIGDITQDIHIGDGTQAVDLVFDFASSIYSVANQDLTIGKKSLGGNDIIIDTPSYLNVQTDSGYVRVGPVNTSFAHFTTDRGKYYFNKPIVIDGGNTNGDAYLISSYNTEDFVIATNNGTEDRITVKQATGNVGINQTSPQYMLDVAGSVFIGNSGETTALTGAATLEMKGDSALMTFKADNASSGDQIAGIRVFANDYRSAGMVIGDYDNSDGSTTEDWIFGRQYASTNKVGIMATPENGGDEYVTAVNESQNKVIIAADNDDIDFQIKGTSSTYFHADAANERVGIGTTSPGHLLEVAGGASNGEIVVNRTSGAEILLQAQSATGVIGTSTNHNLDLKTNGSTRMRIESDGDVGIGTTSPGYKLDVNGSIRAVDDMYTDKLIASEGIRSSSRASFNTMQMYYYDRQNMGTQAVLLRVPVGGSSTANPSPYYMPHAGVVMQVMMGFYAQTLATSGTDTWSIIKTDTSGTASSVDFDVNFANLNRIGTTNSYNILIDLSVLADVSNVDFVAGDMLQIQRTDSSPISIGNCNAQLWVTFNI